MTSKLDGTKKPALDLHQVGKTILLKLTADTADGFGRSAEVTGNHLQRHSLQHMRCMFYQLQVAIAGRGKLCVHKSFFQPHIIFFVGNAHQPFNIVMRIKQGLQVCFADAPHNAAFQKLQIFYSRLCGGITVKGGDEIVFETKPVCDFFSIGQVVAAYGAALHKIQMPAHLTLPQQEIAFGIHLFFETLLQSGKCIGA